MNTSQKPLDQFKEVCDLLVTILSELESVAYERDAEEIVWQDGKETRQKMAKGLSERAINVANKKTFKLAVVGEFKAGKSTFINALLGREILSTNYKPDTAVKTVLTYGETEQFIVTYHPFVNKLPETFFPTDLKEELAKYTSDSTAYTNFSERLENDNATLATTIQEVVVWCKSDFLQKQEIDIVDTPGLGSVFPGHKEVTYTLVPQMDATMFLFPIDRGIGAEDVLFLKFMRGYVKQIFFVMTKSDHEKKVERLPERAQFNRDTIQANVGFKKDEMNPVYPVSAETELENADSNSSASGFPEVVNALIQFLVSSSGVARLDAPLEYAREKQIALLESTQIDVQDVDKGLETLKKELFLLENEHASIEESKKAILSDIANTIEEMKFTATDSIENLPVILQQNVETKIDAANKDQLKNINREVEIVIKDDIEHWVNKKVAKFEASQQLLEIRVDREMKNIIEHLEAMKKQTTGQHISEVDVPTSEKWLSHAAWRVRGKMAGKAVAVGGGASGFMLGALVLGALAGGIVLPILLIVGAPLVAALGALGFDAFSYTQRTKQILKDELKKPLPESGLTTYRLVVQGGNTDRGYQKGLETILKETFTQWGNELQDNVNNWVDNQIDSRLSQLRLSVAEKQSGLFNRENNLKRYQKEIATLQELDRQLIVVETKVQDMRQGKYTDQEENQPAGSPEA